MGSSASSSGGCPANARATATRCCSPAGELVRVVVQLRREPREPQDVGQLRANLTAAGARHLQRVGDVVVDGARRQQLEVLEYDTHVAPVVRDALAVDLPKVTPGNADEPLGGLELLDQQAHQRGLARAGGANEEHELLAAHRKRRPLEPHPAGTVELGDPTEFDHRVRPRRRAERRGSLDRGRGSARRSAPAASRCAAVSRSLRAGHRGGTVAPTHPPTWRFPCMQRALQASQPPSDAMRCAAG